MRQSPVVAFVATLDLETMSWERTSWFSLGDVGLLHGEVLLLDFRAAAMCNNHPTDDQS